MDRWLIERHRLPAVQRWEVRQALLYGRMPDDPALKGAVRDLAGGALRSQVKLGRGLGLACWITLAEAALMIAIGPFSSSVSPALLALSPYWLVGGKGNPRAKNHSLRSRTGITAQRVNDH